MWEKYEPGATQPEEPQSAAPPLPYAPPLPAPLQSPYVRAGGRMPAGGGAGLAIAVVGIVAAVGIGVSAASSDVEPDRSGWDACIESYADEEPGILTPADFCEIGHERPPGYTDYDDYDFDPFNPDQYDSWSDYP